jgi:hypothetical protein
MRVFSISQREQVFPEIDEKGTFTRYGMTRKEVFRRIKNHSSE